MFSYGHRSHYRTTLNIDVLSSLSLLAEFCYLITLFVLVISCIRSLLLPQTGTEAWCYFIVGVQDGFNKVQSTEVQREVQPQFV